LCFGLL
ncbi:hypothetical protein D039_4852B, partial [Vibrio parahaemolyticus EKP-028]